MGAQGLTLGDLPNIFIMIGALIALFIMLVILLRNMEVIGIMGEGRSDGWARAMPAQLLMQRVHIPFTFKLEEGAPISYSEVRYSVSSSVRYRVACWWGAPVRELHAALWASLPDILAEPHMNFVESGPHGTVTRAARCTARLRLGAAPRAHYPLVVVLARDPRDLATLRPDDMVALVSVVHIRDEQCALPSGVIAQYLKHASGHISCLKQLYVTGDVGGEVGGTVGGETGDACCVCAAAPLSRALLPCRHACLCAHCLPKLDKCPICRSVITSYFCLRNEEEPLSELKAPRHTFNLSLYNLFHYH